MAKNDKVEVVMAKDGSLWGLYVMAGRIILCPDNFVATKKPTLRANRLAKILNCGVRVEE